MASFFSKMLLKSSYKSVYGDKAIINILDDTVEVVSGNRKVIHNKATAKKIEETFYENNKVRIIKYNEDGHPETEEVYMDGVKQLEKALGEGKSTEINTNESGLEKTNSVYFKDGVEYKETTYKFKNKLTEAEYTVINIENETEVLKNIVKKKGDEVLIDIQKKLFPDGRIQYYKFNDLEIEVEYFNDEKLVKRYSRHWEEPVFEEIEVGNGKKTSKMPKEDEKKQVGTKIRKEIVEYNEKGNIVYLETDSETIRREFNEEGSLKKQYSIIDGERGKEIVGKIITEDKDIKIINNSTLPNDRITKINEDMDTIEFRYEDNLVMMYDFMFWDGGIEVTEEFYQINNKFEFKKRIFDKLENNVDYRVEETYKNNALYAVRMINKLSKTELYSEGERRFIKGFNGIEKEISEEEFELYKMADALNKI